MNTATNNFFKEAYRKEETVAARSAMASGNIRVNMDTPMGMSSTRGMKAITPLTSVIKPVQGDAQDLSSPRRLYRNV